MTRDVDVTAPSAAQPVDSSTAPRGSAWWFHPTVRYIAVRVGQMVLTLLGVATVVFITSRLTGDPVRLMDGAGATPDQIEQMRHALGVDAPWPVQYWRFITGALHGDLGMSLWQRQPVTGLVLDRLP